MSFSAIPNVPQQGEISEWEATFYSAVKQNLDLLTGQYGNDFAAVLAGNVVIAPVPSMTLRQITTGDTLVIGADNVTSYTNYLTLLADMTKLANDVSTIRSRLNALIAVLGTD